MKSPYRDDFRIRGFKFGTGEPIVAIVGNMRGDEFQQMIICSKLLADLKNKESQGLFVKGKSVLVIPSCNPFSMNVACRFWPMDNTDINRMFPGYDKGETTQRIAAAIFKNIQGYQYGIQLASYYIPGLFISHVRQLKTGYENIPLAKLFGLPFVTIHKPLPFDTTFLNFNWQIWNTKAFSLYSGPTNFLDENSANLSLEAIIRFLNNVGVLSEPVVSKGFDSQLLDEDTLINISTDKAGLFVPVRIAGDYVNKGDVLARIVDPYDSTSFQEIVSIVKGEIFFSYNKPFALDSALLFKIQSID